MKKISLILLILIYTTSTFGMVVKEFYCCGKLASISLSFSNVSKQKCEKKIAETGCCQTKYFLSKIKDDHVASDAINFTTKHFIPIAAHFSAINIVASTLHIDATNGIHDPPILHGKTPIFIFISVIRI
jgi:hypothetical protein